MKLTTFSYEIGANGVAVAKFDVPERSMNTLTKEAIADIQAITKETAENEAVKGLVITSGKDSGFCAGADLGEMQTLLYLANKAKTPEDYEAVFNQAFTLNRVFRELETCGKPVAIAINGLAMGGGLELALSCHYRIVADDNPKLKLALPEAKIGLLPGAGGTQRFTRLTGIQAAAPYLLQGKSMAAKDALGLGIVHATAPSAELVEKASEWVLANPKAKAPWDDDKFRVPGGVPNRQAGATQALTVGNAMLVKETYGNYPAQKNILSCVYEGLQVPFDTALKIESRYFAKTVATPEAQGMVRTLFQSLQDLSKGASRPEGIPQYEIKKVGVVGAGLMGAGIAYVQAAAGIETVLLDVEQASADRGKEYSQKIVDKAVKRGRMTAEKGEALLSLITPTTDYDALKGADLVIEAVFENPKIKAEVTAKCEAQIADIAVMGSNTSTLPITGLAEASARPENFIGIHFFSPVERMGLVEIIMGEKTTQETLAKAIDYVLKIKKTPVAVNDFRGFYTSRCFSTYTHEGLTMLNEGIAPAIIENVGRQSGMPMGPLEVSDSVGLDTALKIGRQMAEAEGKDYNDDPLGVLMAWMVEDKARVGRKAGKGFYDYDDNGKPSEIWKGLADHAEVTVSECPPAMREELIKRLLVRQSIEVARCFEEGVITDARDGDVGSILAWGFAPYSGGAVSYIDLKWGIKAFVEEADRLAEAYGDRFRPGAMLREMAEKGQTFYERFPPAGK